MRIKQGAALLDIKALEDKGQFEGYASTFGGEAKKRGMTINPELTVQIEAQADRVGRLTGELEAGQLSQQRFEQAVDGITDAFAGALIAGESFRDGMAQVG